MTATPHDPTVGIPPGVPANMIAPTGNVPAVGIGTSQDYPRLVYAAPYFTTVAIADVIEPSVMEAVENVLPSLIPPYVDQAVLAGIQQYAVLLTGSTMSGPLFLNPLMPTADSQAATKAYVDTMLATAGIPEVPPVPTGQIWARETGQWVPISQSEGTFLPLAGGIMAGSINMSGNTITNMAAVPAMPNGAAPAQWVLNQIASVSLYQGTWNADDNVPDLTQLSTHVNGYTWIAITTSVSGVVIGPAIPGLQGMTIYNGDTIIYSTAQGTFSAIHAGGLTLPEADARYVQLAGSQMSGALLLNANASQNMQAVTFQQLEAAVANTVTPDAPADGQAYARVGVGTNRWVPAMPLAGGIFTGAVTLAGPGAAGNNPVTVTQLNSAISAAQAGFMPIAGGTFTGPVILTGNATANLNPVPLQQLNAMLATYATQAFVTGGFLPLSGGTLTGNLSLGTNQITASGGLTTTNLAVNNNATISNTLNVGAINAGSLDVTPGNATIAQTLNVGNVTGGNATIGGVAIGSNNVNAPGNISAGTLLASASINSNGSRILSIGSADQPSVVCIDLALGYGMGIGIVTSGQLGFCQSSGNGVPTLFMGSIDAGGNMHINGALSQGSDQNLKRDIMDYAPGVSIARYLSPKTFIYNADEGAKERLGFVAQDIEPLVPHAVSLMSHADEPTLGLDATALTAVLANAVKQLISRVEVIESECDITPTAEQIA